MDAFGSRFATLLGDLVRGYRKWARLSSMSRRTKIKLSVTLSNDVVKQLDAYGARRGITNRSNIIELWLRRAARAQAELQQDTIAYYERLTQAARDDDAWSSASSRELERLDID